MKSSLVCLGCLSAFLLLFAAGCCSQGEKSPDWLWCDKPVPVRIVDPVQVKVSCAHEACGTTCPHHAKGAPCPYQTTADLKTVPGTAASAGSNQDCTYTVGQPGLPALSMNLQNRRFNPLVFQRYDVQPIIIEEFLTYEIERRIKPHQIQEKVLDERCVEVKVQSPQK